MNFPRLSSYQASGAFESPNSGSISFALPSLFRSTRKANSMGKPSSMECSIQAPCGPGFLHQRRDFRNQEQLTMSMRPSPSTSMGRSLKLSTYPFVYGSSRNLWGVQLGPAYQYSPETMSSLPSPLTSATAAVSLAP